VRPPETPQDLYWITSPYIPEESTLILYTVIGLFMHYSPSIIRMMKSRRTSLAGHVARMGEKRNARRILVGSQKETDHWEDQYVGGWTILSILER
jgi:hypothetical protein